MRNKANVAFGLLLLMLLVNAGLSSWSAERLIDHNFWVTHTHEVISELEGILADVTTAETSQRGYILIGPERGGLDYLQPYREARARIPERLKNLRRLMADNPSQKERIDVLEAQVQKKLAVVGKVIAIREQEGFGPSVTAFKTDAGERRMDAIRLTVKNLRADEEKLLAKRTAEAEFSASVTRLTLWTGAIFSAAFLGFAYMLIVRDFDRRLRVVDLIRQEREWLEVTLLGIGDGVIATDAQGRISLLNPVAQKLTGWSQAEAVGQPIANVFRIVHEKTRQTVPNPAEKALQSNTIIGLANHTVLLARDGTERPIDDSGGPIRSAGGRVVGAVLIFRDITERRAAEIILGERARLAEFAAEISAALAQSHTLTAMLQQCTAAIVRHLDAACARIWTLEETGEELELQAGSGIHTNLDETHSRVRVGESKIGKIAHDRKPHLTNAVLDDPPSDDQDWARREGMVAFAGYPLVVEDRLVGVLALCARQALSKAILQGLASAADQIAVAIDRKRVEEAERQQRGWLHVTLSSVADAVIATDAHGLVSFMNRVAEELTGWSEGEAERRPLEAVFRIIGEQSRAPLATPIQKVLEGGETTALSNHTILIARDGTERPIADSAAPIRSGAGAIQGVVLVFRDVSEVRAKEKERERLLAREQEARARAEASEVLLADASRRKDNFLALLGHELRNPLAPIRNAVSLLSFAEGDAAAIAQARDMIDRQVWHLTRMVDELLDAARIANGKIQLRLEILDLGQLVRAAAEDHRADVEAAGLQQEVNVPPLPLWVKGDAVRLTQVVSNLLLNCVKFTDAGGQITVEAAQDDDERRACVVVRDTGVGMEAPLLEQLFEPFEQADRSLDRSRGGLGLGLAVVKGLLELHSGGVQATSAGPGKGSEFRFWLPLAKAPPVAPDSESRPPTDTMTALRILIIEDNKDAADSLRMVLELSGGHAVTVTYAGPAGIEMARKISPDVVLCDLGLPGISGYDVARTLRCEPSTQAARLIAISGYGQDEDRRKAAEAGFDRFLVKPVEIEALVRMLAEVTTASLPAPADGSTRRDQPA